MLQVGQVEFEIRLVKLEKSPSLKNYERYETKA